jgi:hypothetical protein
VHGLNKTTVLAGLLAGAAACNKPDTSGRTDTSLSGEGTGESGTGSEGGTASGGVGELCDGAEPGEDIIINSPDDLDPILGTECIPGKLLIDSSSQELLNLQGLESVKEIGTLEIRYNITLESLSGLDNVWRIGSLRVVGNKALPDLADLKSLSYLDATVLINSNDAMTGLAGLEQLTEIETLVIDSNPVLADYGGLSALEEVGQLELINNDTPTDVTGFSKLVKIRDELHIQGNDGLTSLDGFSLLQSVGETIWISDNTNLPTCTAQEFVDGIPDKGGASQIYDNKPDACSG